MKLILQAIKALFRKIEASRTHWEEVEEVEILAETTVTIPEDNSDVDLPKTTQLTVGKTYFVILDGVSYECVAWYSDDENAVIIGNGAIFGGEGGNGEPFSCDSYSSGDIYLNTEKAGTYTISISTKENIIHKLDKKYLPDQIQTDWNQNDETAEDHIKNRTHYEEVIDEYVIFEGTLPEFDTTTGLPLQYAIPSNTRVTAYYNRSIVATVVGRYLDGSAATGMLHYAFDPELSLTVDNNTMKASVYNGFGDGVLKFVVENFTAVHTLDEKYLPNNVTGMINSKMDANNPVGRGSFSMVGMGSFSMGRNPDSVIGVRSHAEGSNTTASGDYSHAEGISTIAGSMCQHVQGRHNIEDSSDKYAHIVGNGVSSVSRSNAHTLDWRGVPWYQGRPQFGGTAMDNGAQTVMANGDKEIILASSTAGSTKKFKITVDDAGTLTATEVT